MIAAAGRKLFDDPAWTYELKYDGFRALLFADPSGVRFISRRGSNLNTRLPELDQVRKELKGLPVVLDGEIIAGNGSIASFRELRHRYAKAGITSLTAKEKVALRYVVFDVLAVKGRSVMQEPLSKRKAQLADVLAKGAKLIVPAKSVKGRGTTLFAEAESKGFEGVVAKRLDSVYETGKRSKSWLKFKNKKAIEETILRRDIFNK